MRPGKFGKGLSVLGVLQAVVILGIAGVTAAHAGDAIPECPGSSGQPLGINNSQVLQWKQDTPNQFRARAHVEGTVVQVYPDRHGHEHFDIQIGPQTGDTLEIIYNQDFGATPTPSPGDEVEACGDYITSTAQSGPYPPSPDGAILHWIHESTRPQRHPSGFLMINGQLYGELSPNHRHGGW